MTSPLLILAGMSDEEPEQWEKMPRARLIAINKGLVQMTAQQARIISDLRRQLVFAKAEKGAQ